MAHNTRVFDPPVVFAQTIGPSELNDLDILLSESVNGDQGGVWAPVTPIIIGGAGLQVTGPFSAGFETKIKTLTNVGIGGGSLETFNVIAWTASALAFVDFASVAVGNTIDASLTLDVQTTGGLGDFLIKLVAVQDFGGANVAADIPGSTWITRTTDRIKTTIQGVFTIATGGALRVRLEARTSGVGDIQHYGTGSLIVRRSP